MGGTDLWIGGNKTVAHRKTGAMGSELSVARGWLWGDCLKIGGEVALACTKGEDGPF